MEKCIPLLKVSFLIANSRELDADIQVQGEL